MRIILEPEIALDLETIAVQTGNLEFSGLAFARIEGNDLVVYDYVVMDVGSSTLTEISPEIIIPLTKREDKENLRVWFHRHPVGNGVPGPHNWSGTDNDTIEKMPLGGIPELVGWSASIVRTPKGWVGRIDNHKEKTTVHVGVYGQARQETFDTIEKLKPRYNFPKAVDKTNKNWTLDGDIEWEPMFNREQYATEHAYLSDLADYYGAFVDEFDVAADGTVYLDSLYVGKTHPKRKKLFGLL